MTPMKWNLSYMEGNSLDSLGQQSKDLQITQLFPKISALTECHHNAVNNTLAATEVCHPRNHLVNLRESHSIEKKKLIFIEEIIWNFTNKRVRVLIVKLQSDKCADQIVRTGYSSSLCIS